ncbi:MAG: outer membrane protein [Ferrovibrionaceae bacterium]
MDPVYALRFRYLALLVPAALLLNWPAGAADWSGFYGGVHLGYGAGRDQISEVNGQRRYYADTRGAPVGLQVGWQRQFSQIVAGGEFEGGYLGQSGTVSRGDANGSVASHIRLGAYATLAARLGWAPVNDWLIYGRAGLTLAALDAGTVQQCGPAACSLSPSSSSTGDLAKGVVLGGGVEHRFASRWSGRVEYQYLNFRRELAMPDGTSGPAWNHEIDTHLIKLGVNYRF